MCVGGGNQRFGDYSDVLKEIRQKEKENKTDTVSVVNRSK